MNSSGRDLQQIQAWVKITRGQVSQSISISGQTSVFSPYFQAASVVLLVAKFAR